MVKRLLGSIVSATFACGALWYGGSAIIFLLIEIVILITGDRGQRNLVNSWDELFGMARLLLAPTIIWGIVLGIYLNTCVSPIKVQQTEEDRARERFVRTIANFMTRRWIWVIRLSREIAGAWEKLGIGW